MSNLLTIFIFNTNSDYRIFSKRAPFNQFQDPVARRGMQAILF